MGENDLNTLRAAKKKILFQNYTDTCGGALNVSALKAWGGWGQQWTPSQIKRRANQITLGLWITIAGCTE